jgi:hypothetical protein
MTVQYYGKDFGVIGTAGGGTLTLDGSGVALTFNAMQSVASEGFHTVQYTVGSAATAIIQAFDFVKSVDNFKINANIVSIPTASAITGPSEIALFGGNGNGAVANKIRRFTSIQKQIGNDITLTQDSNNGDSFTINRDGLYQIAYSDGGGAANSIFGLSVDSNQLTTGIAQAGFNDQHILLYTSLSGTAGNTSLTVTSYLKAGQIVRAHADTAQTNSGNSVRFRIVRVGDQ